MGRSVFGAFIKNANIVNKVNNLGVHIDNKTVKRKGTSIFTYVPLPERIYNPITAMGFLAMFTFQLDNAVMGVVDTFRHVHKDILI